MDFDAGQLSPVTQSTTGEQISSPLGAGVSTEATSTVKESAEVKPHQDAYRYEGASTTVHSNSSRLSHVGLRSVPQNSFLDNRPHNRRIALPRPGQSRQFAAASRLNELIKQVQRKYELPKAQDLVKVLKPLTQQLVQSLSRQAKADGELVDPNKFFEMLERVVPLALAVINSSGKQGSIDYSVLFQQMSMELKGILNHLMTSSHVPGELKGLMQQLQQQLQGLNGSGEPLVFPVASLANQLEQLIAAGTTLKVGENEELIRQLVDSGMLSKKYLDMDTLPLSAMQKALAQLQNLPVQAVVRTVDQLLAMLQSGAASNMEGRQMLLTQLTQFQAMGQALSVTAGDRTEFMQVLMGNQLLYASGETQGMLGPKTQEIAGRLSDLIVHLAQQIGLNGNHPLVTKSGSESLFRLFSSILFGGAIFGRMIADRGNGKPWEMDEAYAGQLQMQSARELKIFDLVPFSLFAFYTPLKGNNKNEQEQRRKADHLMKELIRLIMKLAFMLTSIYTGGKKIGSDGIDYLLSANKKQLDHVLKQLTVVMKKIGGSFDIDIRWSITFLRRARQSLREENYQEFWAYIFAFFTDKNDLNVFLEEVEELDAVYASIHSIIDQDS
jgi:hypothetical protein